MFHVEHNEVRSGECGVRNEVGVVRPYFATTASRGFLCSVLTLWFISYRTTGLLPPSLLYENEFLLSFISLLW